MIEQPERCSSAAEEKLFGLQADLHGHRDCGTRHDGRDHDLLRSAKIELELLRDDGLLVPSNEVLDKISQFERLAEPNERAAQTGLA